MAGEIVHWIVWGIVTLILGVLQYWNDRRIKLLEAAHQDCLKAKSDYETDLNTPWPSDASDLGKIIMEMRAAYKKIGKPFVMRDVVIIARQKLREREAQQANAMPPPRVLPEAT